MDQQTAKTSAAAIVAGLKKAGIDFVASLPDEKMLEVIRAVETDPDLKHVPLCREEEGIGICAGAYLAGKKTAIIMQNAGFLNSCNALTTTSLQFQIPILMLIYYAGDLGDRGFTTLGAVTEPVLQAMGFRTYVLRRRDEIDEILQGAQILADDANAHSKSKGYETVPYFPPSTADAQRDRVELGLGRVEVRVHLHALLEGRNLRGRGHRQRRVLPIGAARDSAVDGDRAAERDASQAKRARGLEHVLEARRVEVIVGLGREAARGRGHEVHDAVDLVAADHLEHFVGVGHVHLGDHDARAEVALEYVRDAAGAVLREDDALADLEESQGRVQADEPHAADDQNHEAPPRRDSPDVYHRGRAMTTGFLGPHRAREI